LLRSSPKVTYYREFVSRAYVLLASHAAAMGHLDEALAVVRDRQVLWAGNAPELYALAADLAKASTTWNQGADSDKLAELAVKALQESVAAGFKDGPRLRGDPAFAALRDRADFEAIVSTLPSGKER
jgi:ATP/maltotriose-dependent transcriptional regulator MalT